MCAFWRRGFGQSVVLKRALRRGIVLLGGIGQPRFYKDGLAPCLALKTDFGGKSLIPLCASPYISFGV